jgi:hypothetical protein
MSSPVFVLSTGRTGTQFFEDYINGTSETAYCRHEPRPSRRFKFLSNMYLNDRVSSTFVSRTYARSRRRLFRQNPGKTYIESSNFMFGCIPALNERYEDIRVLHIVRHPLGYVKSHLNKGFWRGHKKLFAKYVPYWLENLGTERPKDPIEVLWARWNYVNRQIQSYADSNPYLLVRFEDLFSGDLETSASLLNQIRQFCGLEALEIKENMEWLSHPKNRSVRSYSLSREQEVQILNNTKTLREEFQYIP